MKKIIIFSFLLIANISSFATHVTSTNAYYEFVRTKDGQNQYLVTFELVRDVYGSVVNFDDLLLVGIYDDANQLLTHKEIPLTSRERLPADSPRRFEKAFYSTLLNLPDDNKKYILFYQRCCRNSAKNIISDIGTGLFLEIDQSLPSIVNKLSRPSNFPTYTIKAKENFTIHFPETGDYGSTYTYSLTAPLHGADKNDPYPIPPSQLPQAIQVQYPNNYSAEQPFGTSSPLVNFDSTKGFLTVKAENTGAYAIGILVKESLNGIAIRKYIREFAVYVLASVSNKDIAVLTSTSLGNKMARLNWQAYSKDSISSFTIEKLWKGVWTDVKSVPSNIFTYKDSSWSTLDSFFRIKVTKNNQTSFYSNIDTIFFPSYDPSTLTVENTQLNTITIYPNPVKRFLNIPENIFFKSLSDIGGKSINVTVDHYFLELSMLSPGIYLLKISDGQGNIYTRKIIKE